MFYSQIIMVQKKGPLANLWLAAHHSNDKKLGGRPQIFATDIAASVDSIVHPTVPLALRVSGHLLWGVVRIYSKKVHYLLHDCHQAVLKLKLAFRNNNHAEQVLVIDLDERRRKRRSSQTAEDIVAHFGEFTEGDEAPAAMAGAFQVPVTWNQLEADQENWMNPDLGDDDEEDDEDQNKQKASDVSPRASAGRRGGADEDDEESPVEEEWTAFNPDDDEEEDEEDDRPRLKDDKEYDDGSQAKKDDDSRVSEIELTRAADVSVNSESLTRVSVLDKGSVEPPSSPGAALVDDGGFLPDSPMPIMDDDVDQGPPKVPQSGESRSTLGGLSDSRDDSSLDNRRLMSIGGLNLSHDNDDASDKKRKSGDNEEDKAEKPKRKRRRKAKRKVHMDEQLELSGAFIRRQLEDTSDIVRQDIVHPATWVPGKEPEKRQHPNTEALYDKLSYERLFTRPALGDDGHLAPELLELWSRHTAVVVGKPFPYELRDGVTPDKEHARHEESDEGSDRVPGLNEDDDGPPLPDEDDQPLIMDDDERPPLPDDDDVAPATDDEEQDEDVQGLAESPDSRNSTLSFSLVNDLLGRNEEEEDDEDNPRQTLGSDELISSKTKWHKHTVQVFSLLKSRMSAGKTAGDESDEGEEKPSELSYSSLSHGCTRRTAATVFLELLQLKTWDYVELDQDETFGDITILPGAKFDDEVPTKE